MTNSSKNFTLSPMELTKSTISNLLDLAITQAGTKEGNECPIETEWKGLMDLHKFTVELGGKVVAAMKVVIRP